jgi:DNA-binding transcriptional ArsR family regulator
MDEESAPEDMSASPEDTSLTAVLEALDDPDCRAILRETAQPTAATELLERCDIPKSTLYRKLDLLGDASLLREQDTINPEGGRTTKYERNFDDVLISIDETDTFSVTVKRPQRKPDERLADIWSTLGDEL